MRRKNALPYGLDYQWLFREPINRLHKRWDGKHGADTVSKCADYALLILNDPFTYTGPTADHRLFCSWYRNLPDLFLDTLTTLRGAWFAPTDGFRAQIFIATHAFITDEKGRFVPIEKATDGQIAIAIENETGDAVTKDTVKGTRQKMAA